jgi:uncharacterized protein (UPF0264 family)
MSKLLTIALLAFAGSASAATVGVHTVSKHANETFERTYTDGSTKQIAYNNVNPGVYFIADNGAMVGVYRNSYRRTTVYAGWTFYGPAVGPVSTSLSVAVATGYDNLAGVGALRPMVLPSVSVALPVGVSVRYSAAPGKDGFFQHLSIERKF